MGETIIEHAAGFGPEWFMGFVVLVGFGVISKMLLDEYKRQNDRKAEQAERDSKRQAELDVRREERKRDELSERATRDRERSEMEGRIAAQMERSNTIQEGLQVSMVALTAATEALHNDIVASRDHSLEMAAKVDHIYDRVDLLYETNNGRA